MQFFYSSNSQQQLPTGVVVDVIYSPNPTDNCNECLRAAGAVFNKDGHLIVTGDSTSEIFRVAYNTTLPVITNVNHVTPNSVRSIYSNNLLSFALFMLFTRTLSQYLI